MAVAYSTGVETRSDFGGGSGTVSASVPTGLTTGDVWYVHANDDCAGTVTVSMSGFNNVSDNVYADGLTTSGEYPMQRSFWKAAGSSESAVNVSFGTFSYECNVFSMRITGADTTSPVDSVASTGRTPVGTGSATFDAPDPSSVTSNDSLAILTAIYHSSGASASSFFTHASATSRQTRIALTNYTHYYVGTEARNSGAYSPGNFTTSLAGAQRWSAQTVVIKPAASGAYTLTADRGTYTLTGVAANTLTGRKVVGDAGAYTLTGIAANTLYGRRLQADAGSYVLTGLDASLLKTWLLSGEAGSYTLIGIDASLVYDSLSNSYTLVCETGTYVLSGQDAAVLVGRVLNGEAGTYSISGQAANVIATRLLTAEAGSYTLTGVAANTLKSYLITGEAGNYVITGRPATLDYSGSAPVTQTAQMKALGLSLMRLGGIR